ncbi:MAG TPA: thioredoxin domain-containing protein [Caulobacterales bacterium]|nr:thioredoxin domain-containing protein [Caulobacterales bacterium]
MSPLSQIACPHCGTGNRIAPARDPGAAKCGQCGAPLFPGAPIEVNDEAFARHLRLTKGAALVDVWAPWCGPCRMMAPHFAQAARELTGKVVFLKMNADECAAPQRLGVRGIPALFLFKDGKLVAQQAGLIAADRLIGWIESALTERSPA